jgi:hypothetical protein
MADDFSPLSTLFSDGGAFRFPGAPATQTPVVVYKPIPPGSSGGAVLPVPVPQKPSARRVYDLQLGWNTRAYMGGKIVGPVDFTFRAPTAIGAIVGFTEERVSAGYADMQIAVLISGGNLQVLEYGIPVFTTSGEFVQATDGVILKKRPGVIEVWMIEDLDILGGIAEGLLFSYPTTLTAAYLSAAMYAGGDSISGEQLAYPSGVDSTVPALLARIFQAAQTRVESTLPAITSLIHEPWVYRVESTLPAVRSAIAHAAYVSVTLPAIRSQIFAGDPFDVIDIAFVTSDIPPVYSYITGIEGSNGEIEDAPIPAVRALVSQGEVHRVYGILPGMESLLVDGDPTFAQIVNIVSSVDEWRGRSTIFVVMNESMEVVGLIAATEVNTAVMLNEIDAADDWSLAEFLKAVIDSVISSGDMAALKTDGMSVWALHMDAMGSTRYENYNFNSFATIDGVTYGVNATGIHRLDGDKDGAAKITGTVDFGSYSFGTNNRKALPYVYIGMSAKGKPVLKVESDGNTYFYTARDSTELMKAHRFEPGRGLRSTFYGLTLISDHSFDLHNIDFQPIELKRSL